MACCGTIRELTRVGIVRCLNQSARSSRVYGLTKLGRACHRVLSELAGEPAYCFEFPEVDWELYGWVCYSHRSAILKAMVTPMIPAHIKRRARANDENLRMSANNVRDVIRLFLARGLVDPVRVRGRSHPMYALTETGERIRALLLAA